MLSLPAQVRVFLCCAVTDMRKQFDGLCALVEHSLSCDPYAGDVFVFFNRRRDRVKLLLWDGNGFWMLAKRLESGRFDAWRYSSSEDDTHVEIDRARLMMLLEGIDAKKAKFRRHFSRSVRIGRRGGGGIEDDQGRSRADRRGGTA